MKKPLQKVLYDAEGYAYYWSGGDLHTNFGIIKEKDIKDGRVKTHLGKELYCMPASFLDQVEKINRGPAIITKKDIGVILANIPLDKNTRVVDAGTGCGLLAACLARISTRVTSYECNEKHYEIAKKNAELLEVKYNLKKKDIYECIDEKNVDVITLDLAEPWRVLSHALLSLKIGGYLVAYLPQITQVERLVNDAAEQFLVLKTVEVIEREWLIEPPKVRPKHQGLLHTGFLVFLRKKEP